MIIGERPLERQRSSGTLCSNWLFLTESVMNDVHKKTSLDFINRAPPREGLSSYIYYSARSVSGYIYRTVQFLTLENSLINLMCICHTIQRKKLISLQGSAAGLAFSYGKRQFSREAVHLVSHSKHWSEQCL